MHIKTYLSKAMLNLIIFVSEYFVTHHLILLVNKVFSQALIQIFDDM